MTTAIDLEFHPPAKGGWISLRDHFPRALTAEFLHLLPATSAAGEAEAFAAYGLPVKTLTMAPVHGHVYVAPAPLVGKPTATLPPPAVLWLVARLVPAFRRRNRAALRALATRPWLAEADHWYATERAEWVAKNRALTAEAPDDLSDADLIAHLRRARAHLEAGYTRHFSLHGPDLMPTGLLLARCEDWGVPAEVVLPVLEGASPASLGQGPELDALRAAVASADRPVETLDDLRAVAGSALDAFLADHGWRLVTGYDLDARALVELPALVVSLACSRPAARPEPNDAAAARLRERVPADATGELEQLVADARATFGIRDDNGALTAAWPAGLLRRAMLAAGRRLTATGSLEQAEHAVELTVDELVSLLEGRGGPDASERAAARAAKSRLVPPAQLGPDLDVPLDQLPAPMRRMARAQLALRDSFTAPLTARADLHGDGLGTAAYQGRACVAHDAGDALTRLEPGDVLVAMGTTPAYNMALSIAGAVVVEEGGLLSHAAVIARELGLPAVIGAAGAMAAIADGALVEVDPRAGRVLVLG